MSPVFTPCRLGHVNLIVGDLERSTRFYREVCGLELEFSETGLRGNFLGTGNTHHDLGIIERTDEDRYGKDGHLQIPKSVAGAVGLNHVAWEMETEAELVRCYERAVERKVPIGRVADHQISHSIYMKDPDGNTVEFYADVILDWQKVLHGEVDHITSVWKPDVATASTQVLRQPVPARRHVKGAMVNPVRFSHVVLQTPNLDAMTRFYEDVAGLACVRAGEGTRLLQARAGDSAYHLALVQTTGERGMRRFAFEVADARALAAAGEAASRQKRDAKRAPSIDGESLFVTDPDGFVIEFFARAA